jgi:mRNA interferase YafQ
MLEPIYANLFKRDYDLMKKRHKDMERIKEIMALLVNEQPLPEHCRPHGLSGSLKDYIDCHIQGDWVLLYRLGEGTITFYRTGTHSDLF